MIVDNFKQISKHLVFDSEENPDWFYHVQIISRRKDGEFTERNCKVIRSFYIRNLQYYDEHIEVIKQFCRFFHARAYIKLNPSSWKKCALMAFKELADCVCKEEYWGIRSLVDSMAGKYNADGSQTKWVIDIDTKDKGVLLDAVNIVDSCAPEGHKIVDCLPTKNGYHLLSRPFNVKQFNETWAATSQEDVPDINKNSPTLLYYEDGTE